MHQLGQLFLWVVRGLWSVFVFLCDVAGGAEPDEVDSASNGGVNPFGLHQSGGGATYNEDAFGNFREDGLKQSPDFY